MFLSITLIAVVALLLLFNVPDIPPIVRTNFEYCAINSFTSDINTPAPRAIRIQRLGCFLKSFTPSESSNSFSIAKNYI